MFLVLFVMFHKLLEVQKKNRKMKVRAMEEEFNSSLVLFELMGLQFFSLKLLTRENMNDRPSFLRFFHMVILLVFVSTLMVVFMASNSYAITEENVTAKNVLNFAISNSMNVGLILVVSTSIIQSFMSTRCVKKIFLNVKDIMKLYRQELDVIIDFRRIKKSTLKKVLLVILFFISTHGTVTLIKRNSNNAFPLLLGAIPVFFLHVVVFKFTFYVGMINSQLFFLNKMLGNISTCHQPIKFIDNVSFPVTQIKSIKLFDDPLKKLRTLRRIYNIIYENGTLINNSNGLTILVMFINIVISLTASGYQAFVIVIGGLSPDTVPG